MMKNYSKKIILVTILTSVTLGYSQVGVNTTTPYAQLEIVSSNQATPANNDGLLIPKVNAFPVTNPTTNQNGMMLYLTTAVGTKVPGFYYWDFASLSWIAIGSKTGWSTLGNAGTAVANNFIGTTDANALVFKTSNTERMRMQTTGAIAIGTAANLYATDLIDVQGSATFPFPINGYTTGNGCGIYGETATTSTTTFSSVQGVYYGSASGAGALGNYNGTGTAATRAGVVGVCNAPTGSAGGVGVSGRNGITTGNQRMGVLGQYESTAFGIGVHGVAAGGGIIAGNVDVAVVGWRQNNRDYSGYFNGNHVIANGTKSASVGTSKGNQLLYVTEAPGVWFEDIGRGKLVNGTIKIDLDPLFLETIFVDATHPMSVFLQEEGESKGLIVIKDPTNKGFVVKEKNGGQSNIEFSYRIMAKRLHFQDHRFGSDPVWGAGDTRKYSTYATPPPTDYNEKVKRNAYEKANPTEDLHPEGFITYKQLQAEAKEKSVSKEEINK